MLSNRRIGWEEGNGAGGYVPRRVPGREKGKGKEELASSELAVDDGSRGSRMTRRVLPLTAFLAAMFFSWVQAMPYTCEAVSRSK
jgi:hypothetical protein